jgi:Fe-S oxidoreductase
MATPANNLAEGNTVAKDMERVIAPNGLREERARAGFSTPDALASHAGIAPEAYRAMEDGRILPSQAEFERLLAALGGPEPDRLYLMNFRQLLGVEGYVRGKQNFSELFASKRGPERLLIARDEVRWADDRPSAKPDAPVDVFMSMSCGTQESPHLLLDTLAVCDALGVTYTAAAGAAGCCGKPYVSSGHEDVGEKWILAKVGRAVAAGARAQVNWCTACQNVSELSAAKRAFASGADHPIREIQVLEFFEERLHALGDRVPWQRTVKRRVLAEGHREYSPIHGEAVEANIRLLSLIPGVESVQFYDGFSDESPCGGRARERSQGAWQAPKTTEEVVRRRAELAAIAASRGADTMACQHQGCHQIWSRYASEGLEVKHAVSILAEALGCDHPDRYGAASRLGTVDEVVRQTRPIWTTWGMGEDEARALAKPFVDARFAAGVTACSCGGEGRCREELIDIDVLSATTRPRTS